MEKCSSICSLASIVCVLWVKCFLFLFFYQIQKMSRNYWLWLSTVCYRCGRQRLGWKTWGNKCSFKAVVLKPALRDTQTVQTFAWSLCFANWVGEKTWTGRWSLRSGLRTALGNQKRSFYGIQRTLSASSFSRVNSAIVKNEQNLSIQRRCALYWHKRETKAHVRYV